MTKLLLQVYSAQKSYGDKADEFEAKDALFGMVLAEFSIEQITKAFVQHLKTSKEIPSPSEIYSIICPPAPQPNWSLYRGICDDLKSGSVYVTETRKEYKRWCESFGVAPDQPLVGKKPGYSDTQLSEIINPINHR